MKVRAYIESVNGFPLDDWALSAYLGFRQMQTDIILFEDIEEVPKSKWNIVVACIETTNKYFERFGIPPKKALNIPDELNQWKYLKREIDTTWSMDNFRLMMQHESVAHKNLPLFIKPNGRAKEFIAGVISKQETINAFKDVPGDSPVLLSEVIDIISEYRCYIVDNQVVGLYPYKGDMWKFPDKDIIIEMVNQYKSAPAGYSLDVGITKDGDTVLIECNDGWSLGNYGLEPTKYTRLLTKRWFEIFKAY